MADYKAIETEYNGYRFRSRLEARWAVFFDALGVRYEYELEGFETTSGPDYRYLPDFYLPDFDVYCEVKPSDEKLFEESEKIGTCVDYNNTPVSRGLILLGPIPYSQDRNLFAAHDMLYWDEGVCIKRVRFKARRHGYPTELLDVDLYADSGTQEIPRAASVSATLFHEDDFNHWMTLKDLGIEWDAYKAARHARFEYGETPRPHQADRAAIA